MTKEYREYVKSRIEYLLKISSFVFDEPDREALEMAIQALSQEPTDDKCHYCEHTFTPYKGNTGDFTEQEPCTDVVSREAVKEIINDIRDCISVEGYCAILERLKKLPSVNPQPCDDAISRQAVIDAMSDTWKHICYVARRRKPTKGEEAVYADMVGTVKSMPPVTQKSGQWNTFELFQGGIKETWYECPKCKWSNALLIPRNYCPNCGVKMKG